MKAIVISDDLTGAAEVAGAALRLGASAEVHIGELYQTDAEVVAIDADTRSLTPNAAAAVVSRLTQLSLQAVAPNLLKKVDSVLRGPVLAEIVAMQDAMGLDRCLLVCGNPRKQRLVMAGHLYLDGVPLQATEFALDPEHPCSSGSAIDLLRYGSRLEGLQLSKSIERNLQVVEPGESVASGISIGNVANSAQLQIYADYWFSQRQSVLAAGAAEFIETSLQRCIGQRSNSIDEKSCLALKNSCDRVLLITGTRIPHDDGWPVVSIQEDRSVSECVAKVSETLERDGRAAIRAVNVLDSNPESRLRRLTHVAKQVLLTSRPGEVWIEGGRTASMLLRELGYQRLTAVSNVGEGIVALRSTDNANPLFVVKPGSYPWSPVPLLELPLSCANGWRDTA